MLAIPSTTISQTNGKDQDELLLSALHCVFSAPATGPVASGPVVRGPGSLSVFIRVHPWLNSVSLSPCVPWSLSPYPNFSFQVSPLSLGLRCFLLLIGVVPESLRP